MFRKEKRAFIIQSLVKQRMTEDAMKEGKCES
jgi:hypothetical protein